MAKFTVIVKRTCPQFLRVPANAWDEKEAKEKALELAPDLDFTKGTTADEADYEAEEVSRELD